MPAASSLEAFVPGRIWLAEYPVRYAGTRFRSRMSVVRLTDGRLLLHSPGPIDEALRREIETLGRVAYIVAPGTFHHLHVQACQRLFPRAETHVCPGIERKRPKLRFTALLGDEPPAAWADELDQVAVTGARLLAEVAFLDRPSRTLLLVDLLENLGDDTPGTDRALRLWFRLLGMWNRARPAPEYWLAWGRRREVGAALARILAWDFERVVLAHGDLVERDAKAVLRAAWARPLRAAG